MIEIRQRAGVNDDLTGSDEEPDQAGPDADQHQHAEQHGSELRRTSGGHAATYAEGRILCAAAMMASALWLMSLAEVAQPDTLIRMAGRPSHTVGPHQHVPSC